MKKNDESNLFFEVQKYYFVFESRLIFFSNGYIRNVVSTLPNVVKFDAENDNIVSTLSSVVQFNVEKTQCCFNVVNFNIDIHNVVSTLIWHCLTSRRHTTLTKTLRPCWKVSWVLTNVARLHNFVKFVKLKKFVFSRITLNCCFPKFSKRYYFGSKK